MYGSPRTSCRSSISSAGGAVIPENTLHLRPIVEPAHQILLSPPRAPVLEDGVRRGLRRDHSLRSCSSFCRADKAFMLARVGGRYEGHGWLVTIRPADCSARRSPTAATAPRTLGKGQCTRWAHDPPPTAGLYPVAKGAQARPGPNHAATAPNWTYHYQRRALHCAASGPSGEPDEKGQQLRSGTPGLPHEPGPGR